VGCVGRNAAGNLKAAEMVKEKVSDYQARTGPLKNRKGFPAILDRLDLVPHFLQLDGELHSRQFLGVNDQDEARHARSFDDELKSNNIIETICAKDTYFRGSMALMD
jgi:hypothetical protein